MGLIDNLRERARAREIEREGKYDILSLLRDIISCAVIMAVIASWTLLCLLIISFVLVYYIHFNIKWMIVVSVLAGIAAGVVYIIKTVKKVRSGKS